VRGLRLPAAAFTAFVLGCVLWPRISPYGADEVDFSVSAQGPSFAHPLGTDQFGRDLLTRLAAGGATSLTIAAIALAIILGVGTAYGTIAALAPKQVDSLMMRLVDGLFALPRLPIAIVILVAVRLQGQNVETVALALAVVGWMLTARLVRAQILSLESREYVRAARALGARTTHIALRHFIPNSLGILLVAVLLELPAVIIGEAFFAVLGLGPDPPTATWGNVAQEGLHFGRLWQMSLATAAIAGFALTANALVDRLGDRLDPRRRS
jgi:ABC-type dipeptide/oligopeptide/nickel transport system permease subunit